MGPTGLLCHPAGLGGSFQSSSMMLPPQWVPRVSCVIRRVLVAVGRRRRLVARCNNRLVVLIVKRVPSNRTLSSFQGAGGEVGSPPRSRGGLHWANLVWCGTAPACGYVSLHQGTAGTVPCTPVFRAVCPLVGCLTRGATRQKNKLSEV